MSRERRTAQIAAWAGRARVIQIDAREGGEDADSGELRRLFGRLSELRRMLGCDWIDALTPAWHAHNDDWSAYIEYNAAVVARSEADLTHEEIRSYHRGRLRGLLLPKRHVTESEARNVILAALDDDVPDGDPTVVAAVKRFGFPGWASRSASPRRRDTARAPTPALTARQVPESVRTVCAGKRALIAGGQGVREEHRRAVADALGFASLEWVVSERGQAAPFQRLTERVRPGAFDLVLFLAGYTSHKSAAFVRACKDAAIPLVYVPRGYSVTSIVQAIAEQVSERGRPAEPRPARAAPPE